MKPLVGTANLLAGQAVAHAEAFLAGRSESEAIPDKTVVLFSELRRLKLSQLDLPTSSIIDAAFILTIALRNAVMSYASTDGDRAAARAERWRALLSSLVEHVRRESLALSQEANLA